MLAKHRLVNNRYVVHIGQLSNFVLFCNHFALLVEAVVTVNTDPVHFAAAANLVTAYNRNVVLCATSNHTGTATGTSVQVDSHYPVVNRALVIIPKAGVCFMLCTVATTVVRIF